MPPHDRYDAHHERHFHLDVDIRHHFVETPGLSEALSLLRALTAKVETMDAAIQQGITDLQADVAALTSVVDSAEALIEGFAQQLADAIQAAKDAGASPEQVQALTDLHVAVSGQATELAEAVAAHTTPVPTPTPTPPPVEEPPVT